MNKCVILTKGILVILNLPFQSILIRKESKYINNNTTHFDYNLCSSGKQLFLIHIPHSNSNIFRFQPYSNSTKQTHHKCYPLCPTYIAVNKQHDVMFKYLLTYLLWKIGIDFWNFSLENSTNVVLNRENLKKASFTKEQKDSKLGLAI